ncbi:hypothetical protein C5O00_08580 [Pukyongia salina]|uniref:SH3 domain-containing protein n=1 Tax=Pukyongia salina TaxID=2094025 RepID=A0A2S0HX84_9FLAO|nr:hypothetical protein [Pukyongia salina]AVI51226.1 hypothetical protein C5O00_08580 [Pukyongia salina]
MRFSSLVLFLFVTIVAHSQKVETVFVRNGNISNQPSIMSFHKCEKFKKRHKVYVLEYAAENWWKIEYKGCIGYVQEPFLNINESILNIKKRVKLQAEKNRQLAIQKRLERERIEDSLLLAKVNADKARKDSIRKQENLAREKRMEERRIKEAKEKENYIDSCSITIDEIDEFSGKRRLQTKKYYIDEYPKYRLGELGVTLKRYGNAKYIYIWTSSDLGCVSPYSHNRSTAKFKLENGDIITFYHRGDIDCGRFELVATITSNEIARLKRSPIKTVRLNGTEYYNDYTDLFFTEFFIKKLDCIK